MGIKARGDHRRDRLAVELESLDPGSPRAAEIAGELARGFFSPRPGAMAIDIERAVAAARRIHHVEVPGGVTHPAASELRAHILDRPPAQIDALVAGDLYLGDGDRLHLWPWYPEDDEALRDAAEIRAAELGAEMPERFLDDPFESAWYFKHTGEGALARLFERAGVEPPRLEVAAIPVFDFGEAVVWEGGGRAPPAPAQLAWELRELAHDVDNVEDPELLELLRAALRGLLPRYIAAVNDTAAPPLEPSVFELAGAPIAPREDGAGDAPEVEGAAVIRDVFAIDGGAVLACDGALVVVDAGGAVTAAWPTSDHPWFCGGRVALFEGEGWRALDLESGRWLTGELDAAATFGGPLRRLTPGAAWSEPIGDPISPDGRYAFVEYHGIRRLADNLWVSSEEIFGELDDEGDEGDGAPAVDAPALLDPASLAIPGVAVSVIDGVTFTRRRRQSYQVSSDDSAIAFALAGDRWRAVAAGALRVNDEIVARVPVKCFAAGFAPGGERLWLLLGDHLVRVDWKDEPAVGAVVGLAAIAAAAREARA